MTKEEHQKIINDIMANRDNQAQVSELLATLSEDYGTVLAESTQNKEIAEKITADNEELRNANMKLFLKLGQTVETKTDTKTESNEQTLTYDSLFDEKGNLL